MIEHSRGEFHGCQQYSLRRENFCSLPPTAYFRVCMHEDNDYFDMCT